MTRESCKRRFSEVTSRNATNKCKEPANESKDQPGKQPWISRWQILQSRGRGKQRASNGKTHGWGTCVFSDAQTSCTLTMLSVCEGGSLLLFGREHGEVATNQSPIAGLGALQMVHGSDARVKAHLADRADTVGHVHAGGAHVAMGHRFVAEEAMTSWKLPTASDAPELAIRS